MIVKKTGMVRKTNAVRMLGFSRRLFLKSTDHPRRARITLYHRRFGVHAASWMEPGGTLKWRPIQMPVGGLLVGMAGREDARLVEGVADDLEADRNPVGRDAARQGERGMAAHVEGRSVAQPRRRGLRRAARRLHGCQR